MVSFKLEGRQQEDSSDPSVLYRVVTHSLIVGQNVYKKGDIISSKDVDMDLRYYTGLRLIELVDPLSSPKKKKKNFFQRLLGK